MQNEESVSVTDRINDFIQKNRKTIFIIAALIIVLFAGTIVFLSVQDALNKKAIVELEDLTSRYEELRFYTRDSYYAEDVEKLLGDLNAFVKGKGGLPAAKGWDFIARVHSSREEWKQAEEAWVSSAKKGNRTYLAPLSLANAAVAAEEQGNVDKAIEYLQKAIEHPFEFPGAPRAQFNIGRLYEKQGNLAAAVDAYRVVLVKWSEIPVWPHFARSAILSIEIR
jgi:tetratricopeptide (TPR) repeat protein